MTMRRSCETRVSLAVVGSFRFSFWGETGAEGPSSGGGPPLRDPWDRQGRTRNTLCRGSQMQRIEYPLNGLKCIVTSL